MSWLSAMEVLDGDDVRLSSRGRYAERDIVQVGGMLLYVSLLERVYIFYVEQNLVMY